MSKSFYYTFFLVFIFILHSCAETATFSDSSSVEQAPKARVVGGTCELTWSNPDVQACIDSGRIWNYGTKTCSSVKSSHSYDCTEQGYLNWSGEKGISTKVLTDRLSGGAYLAGCGENAPDSDKTFAMAQFLPECSSGVPITACFVKGSTGCNKNDFACIVDWCFAQAAKE